MVETQPRTYTPSISPNQLTFFELIKQRDERRTRTRYNPNSNNRLRNYTPDLSTSRSPCNPDYPRHYLRIFDLRVGESCKSISFRLLNGKSKVNPLLRPTTETNNERVSNGWRKRERERMRMRGRATDFVFEMFDFTRVQSSRR